MFKLSSQPLQIQTYVEELRNPAAGAFVSFEGWVRNIHEGRAVVSLEYEALAPMCESQADKILAEAIEKFGVLNAICLHRTGRVAVGEMAVWVGVTAGHRDEAFLACRYIIDELKKRLPIWKKEFYTDGSSSWVNCQHNHKELISFTINLDHLPSIAEFTLVDVRSADERRADPVENIKTIHLPATEVGQWKTSIAPDNKYLFFCIKGIRSAKCVELLRASGLKNIWSIQGGVAAVQNYLPSLPKR